MAPKGSASGCELPGGLKNSQLSVDGNAGGAMSHRASKVSSRATCHSKIKRALGLLSRLLQGVIKQASLDQSGIEEGVKLLNFIVL